MLDSNARLLSRRMARHWKGFPMPAEDDQHPLLRKFETLMAADRLSEALALAVDTIAEPPADLREEDLAVFEFEQLSILFELGDGTTLLECLAPYDPEDAAVALFEVRAHLLRWDLERAKSRLKEIEPDVDNDPGMEADRLELEAVIDDLEGRYDASDQKLQRAFELAPDDHPLPPRLDFEEASALLERTLDELPAEIRAGLQNLIIELVPMPRIEAPQEAGVTSPWILGLYTGLSALERDAVHVDPLPPRVEIYQRNLERSCANKEDMEEELRITLLHEVGHHLGFDEDGVAALGLE